MSYGQMKHHQPVLLALDGPQAMPGKVPLQLARFSEGRANPGPVDTPFFDSPPAGALEPDDIARAILYAVSQPPHVDVNELLIRPTSQEN